MRLLLPLCLLLTALLSHPVRAQTQEAEWWSYQAQRNGHVVLIKLDMGLRRNFPLSGFPYVVVTRVSYTPADSDGQPSVEDQARLEAQSEQVAAALGRKTRCLYAGTAFTQGQQQSYFYVIDPNGLEPLVQAVHTRLCPGCKTGMATLSDPAWALYRDQLLPDGETRQRYGLRSY